MEKALKRARKKEGQKMTIESGRDKNIHERKNERERERRWEMEA